MRDGIFIKDVLHRGPASESGKLNPGKSPGDSFWFGVVQLNCLGDRIKSVTISFEHMVYEDALTILSYASPYEVILEAKNGKLLTSAASQGAQPGHPLFRSSSIGDLLQVHFPNPYFPVINSTILDWQICQKTPVPT